MKLKKYENPRRKKAWKVTTFVVCILVFVPCLVLSTFGILSLAGVVDFTNDYARTYEIVFRDSLSDTTYYSASKIRGEKFSYDYKPEKEGYKFRGWDINGDNLIDIIPSRVFKDIDARALWYSPVLQGGRNALY